MRVDDASLNDERSGGGTALMAFGKALQAIDDRDENVLDPAGLQLVHDAQPEFGAFGLFELIQMPENLLGAVRQDPERDVDRLVAHEAFVADL